MNPISTVCDFSIYIYAGDDGKEVCPTNVTKLKSLFKQAYPNSSIYEVSSSEFCPLEWPINSLVILPDGRCSKWKWLNNPTTVSEFRHFVELGSSVFGIGGGAYACCKESKFTMANGEVLEKARGLDFCLGQGIGPLISATSIAPEPIQLKWCSSQEKGYAIVSGGGYFVPGDSENNQTQYEVLATYCDQPKEKSVAVVKCQAGKGKVVLSFPHFEYEACDYPLEDLEKTIQSSSKGISETQLITLRTKYRKIQEGETFGSSCLSTIMQIFEARTNKNWYF